MFTRKQIFLKWKSKIFLATSDIMLTSYFHVCKLWVLPLKTDIWWNVKTHQLVIVLTGPQNMLIRHAIFHCELFPWFIFLAECEILNFVDSGRRTHTASLRGWPLARSQLNGLKLPVICQLFLFICFIPSIFHCPETSCTNLQLHNPCWLCDSQAFLSDVCVEQ